MHSATQLNSTQLNSTQLNYNLNSFKIFASFFDAVKNRLSCISLNARNYLNYALYAILSYGDEVKAKLTRGANKNKYAKGYKFVLSHSKNVIRLKYKFNTSDKSKYELDDKYAIFEQGKVVNSLLFKIIN